jgi:hypothetical protein
MADSYSYFLKDMAVRMLELADRAPDIGIELRRFVDDLIELAAEAEKRKDRSHDEATWRWWASAAVMLRSTGAAGQWRRSGFLVAADEFAFIDLLTEAVEASRRHLG